MHLKALKATDMPLKTLGFLEILKCNMQFVEEQEREATQSGGGFWVINPGRYRVLSCDRLSAF